MGARGSVRSGVAVTRACPCVFVGWGVGAGVGAARATAAPGIASPAPVQSVCVFERERASETVCVCVCVCVWLCDRKRESKRAPYNTSSLGVGVGGLFQGCSSDGSARDYVTRPCIACRPSPVWVTKCTLPGASWGKWWGGGQVETCPLCRSKLPIPSREGGLTCTLPHLRLIDSCATQLKAQGPVRTCDESKEAEEELLGAFRGKGGGVGEGGVRYRV